MCVDRLARFLSPVPRRFRAVTSRGEAGGFTVCRVLFWTQGSVTSNDDVFYAVSSARVTQPTVALLVSSVFSNDGCLGTNTRLSTRRGLRDKEKTYDRYGDVFWGHYDGRSTLHNYAKTRCRR